MREGKPILRREDSPNGVGIYKDDNWLFAVSPCCGTILEWNGSAWHCSRESCMKAHFGIKGVWQSYDLRAIDHSGASPDLESWVATWLSVGVGQVVAVATF